MDYRWEQITVRIDLEVLFQPRLYNIPFITMLNIPRRNTCMKTNPNLLLSSKFSVYFSVFILWGFETHIMSFLPATPPSWSDVRRELLYFFNSWTFGKPLYLPNWNSLLPKTKVQPEINLLFFFFFFNCSRSNQSLPAAFHKHKKSHSSAQILLPLWSSTYWSQLASSELFNCILSACRPS